MRPTENPLAYTFSHPHAKAIVYELVAANVTPYEALRQRLDLAPETFHRTVRRLAQFDLVRLRAPRGSEFEGRRIRLVLRLSPKGRRFVPLLRELDGVVRAHQAAVGARTVEELGAES